MNFFTFVPISIGLENFDKAFALLNKSYEEKNSSLLFIKVEPMFYDLHDDDRFDDILEKIGL